MRAALLIVAICAAALPASASPSYVIAGNTPRFVSAATRRGAADPAETIEVTVWLTMENRALLDDRVQKEYDPASPLYHHWIDRRGIGKMFGPGETKANAVRLFLERSHLAVLAADPDGFYLRARGTVAAMARAFHVDLVNFAYRGQIYRSNTADPVIEDYAGAYVSAIQGLDNAGVHRALIAQQDLFRAPPNAASASAKSSGAFNAACFPGPTTETLNAGNPPTGIFKGNLYDSGTAGCAYTPQQIWTAYDLNSVYAQGYDGTGQSVAIVSWCLPNTLLTDANAFSKKYGLPPLVANQNFSITYYPAGDGGCLPPDADPQLAVEWIHAIAPGAGIEIYVSPYPGEAQILDPTVLYTVENSGANVIAIDWVNLEFADGSTQVENAIAEIAAASGIALNYPSGDDGDYTDDQSSNPPFVSQPADSPYVTAVGGISLGLAASGAVQFQVGWGTNETALAYEGYVIDTTYAFGFIYGSGGGTSTVFAAPPFQRSLKSAYRQEPDIAWLADPFTAAIVTVSVPGAVPILQQQAYGGTGLANYMFSALWAIADQAAGASLGQAAPLLYANRSRVATDVRPVGSTTNVTAKINDIGGQKYFYNAATVARPLDGTTIFASALWNIPLNQDTLYAITFGTDSGLRTKPGWDPVTGLGVPNPAGLINAAIAASAPGAH